MQHNCIRTLTLFWQHSLIAILGISLTVGQCIGLAGIGTLIATQSACNTATVITDVEKFLPVVLDVLQIISAVTGNSNAALAAKITQDEANVVTLVNAYLSQKSTGTASVWNDMNAAFTTFEDDAATVFQLAQISNAATQAKISLIVASAQTLLAVIETLIPSAPSGAVGTATASRKFAAYAPVKAMSLGQWTTSWNHLMRVDSGNAKVDAITPGMEIHAHSWVVRMITFHPGE